MSVHEHTAQSPALLQLIHPQTPRPVMFYSIYAQSSDNIPVDQWENSPKSLWPFLFVILRCVEHVSSPTSLQNKQLACHQCKTYHGKINRAVLCFAHMANFGNASSRVYFKEKIALSVFSKCADLLPPLLSLGASKLLYSNLLAVFTS